MPRAQGNFSQPGPNCGQSAAEARGQQSAQPLAEPAIKAVAVENAVAEQPISSTHPEAANQRIGSSRRQRVLSGMRPTGPLHIGHYFGALCNWLKMQESYDCFFFVADWHALTTHYADTALVAQNTLDVVTDWLSVGLEPKKCTIFVQSFVPEHSELHLLLSMITPLRWLERVPTYREQIENLKDKDLGTYGFLGYPLLQAADIVMYGKEGANLLVPVGEDQVPHVELTREVVRTFNFHFGFEVTEDLFAEETKSFLRTGPLSSFVSPDLIPADGVAYSEEQKAEIRSRLHNQAQQAGVRNFLASLPRRAAKRFFEAGNVLVEPEAMLTETPRLPGTDGRRMAKSYGNAIWLNEPLDSIRSKVRGMMTDPQRVRRHDPGRPEVCPVFAYHQLFSDQKTTAWAEQGCRSAGIGCVDCKSAMLEGLVCWITPVHERRREFQAHPQRVWDILDDGSAKARRAARSTMRRVRGAIFGWEQARQAAKPGGTAARNAASGE